MKVFRVDEFDEELISSVLSDIYQRTSDWLWFSTSLHPGFFSREDIRQRLTELCEEGVSIRVLLDEDVPLDERREDLPWLFGQGCVEIRQSTSDISHRVISDGKHLRLEKDHELSQKGAANLIAIDAVGDFEKPYEEEFQSWWEDASPVE